MSTPGPNRMVVPWRWLIAQFFVIIASVMVALAGDRWMSKREEQAKTLEYLAQLRTDFDANRQIAEGGVTAKGNRAAAASAVLGALDGKRDVNRTTPLPVDVELAGWNHMAHYLSEAWQELLSTGDIRLITNVELRDNVAAFYQMVSTNRDFEDEWRTYVMAYRSAAVGVLDPNLRIRILKLFPDRMIEDSLGIRASDEAILARLRRVPDVGGKLADVVMAQRTGEYFYTRDVKLAEKIVGIIDRELKGGAKGK